MRSHNLRHRLRENRISVVMGLILIMILMIMVFATNMRIETSSRVFSKEYGISVVEMDKDALVGVDKIEVTDVTDEEEDALINEMLNLEKMTRIDAAYKVYDITLEDENAVEVQPNGEVKVSVQLPEGFNPATVAVYYLGGGEETDEAYPTKIDAVADEDKVTFTRTHFCKFCIVAEGNNLSKKGTDNGSANVNWFANYADADEYYLSTGADLRGFIKLLNGPVYFDPVTGVVHATKQEGDYTAPQTDFAGKIICLATDISMSSSEFQAGTMFLGTLDGNGYTIKNLKNTLIVTNKGLICNLGLENPSITGSASASEAAILVRKNQGSIENCYVYGGNFSVGTSTGSAGVIAGTSSGRISNSYVAGTQINGINNARNKGTLVGSNSGTLVGLFKSNQYTTEDPVEVSAFTDDQIRTTGAGTLVEALTNGIENVSFTDVAKAEWTIETYGTHPVFGAHASAAYKDIKATVSLNGEPLTGLPMIAKNDETGYAGEVNHKMYYGYEGVTFHAKPSTSTYTFKGWYDNPAGTGDPIASTYNLAISDAYHAVEQYYAVYTGGPYIVTLVSSDENATVYGENSDDVIYVEKGASTKVHVAAGTGKALESWYVEEGSFETEINGEKQSYQAGDSFFASRVDNAALTITPKENVRLRAVITDGVKVNIDYAEGSSSTMGSISLTGVESVLLGSSDETTVSAAETQRYTFVGWYRTAAATESTLVSREREYHFTIPEYYDQGEYNLYAKFVLSEAPDVVNTNANGIVMISDPGKIAKNVIYQYSSSLGSYRYIDWLRFTENGKGKNPNGGVKADYAANADKYNWNGSNGYRELTNNITTTGIILEYEGYYTFIITDIDGRKYYRNVYISQADIDNKTQTFPTISNAYNTVIAHENGSGVTAVYYQYTSTNVSASSCPITYTTWNGFATAGKAAGVASVNGKNGYLSLPKNSSGTYEGSSFWAPQPGWYTVLYRFGANQTIARYVKITQENILDGSGGIPEIKANYTYGEKAIMYVSVRTAPVEGATKYALQFTNRTTGAVTTVDMYGSYKALSKNYVVYNTNLTSETKYFVQSMAYVDGAYVTNGDKYHFTTAKTTVSSKYNSSYRANTEEGISYANKNTNAYTGRLDVLGKGGIRITFSNGGWLLYRQGESSEFSSSPSSDVSIIPSTSIVTGTSGTEYVKMTYIIRNNTDSNLTNYGIAIGADTQIGSLDSAPISRQPYGLQMSDNSGNILALIAQKDSNIDGLYGETDTATSIWFGSYSGHTSVTNRYSNVTGSVSGVDSAMIVAWKDINLKPGEVTTRSVIMGVVGNGVLVPQPTSPHVSNADGSFDITANNTAESENVFTSVQYAYVSDDVTASSCPFNYDTQTNNINTLANVGKYYSNVNGTTGYRSIEGELIEEGAEQNNLVDYYEPGWYTFVFNYTNYIYQSATNHTIKEQTENCITINVKVEEEDLDGIPMAHKDRNHIVVNANGAALETIVYQLSDLRVEERYPYLYTDWKGYVDNGRGLKDAANLATYLSANSANGYNGSAFDSTKEVTKEFVVTTPGWYTVLCKYKDFEGNYNTVSKYILFTEEDVASAIPSIDKEFNVVIFEDNDSRLNSVTYQLTTTNLTKTLEEIEAEYGYGTGSMYTTVGQNLIKNSNLISDDEVFSRIGLYGTNEKFEAGVKDSVLTSENTDAGHKYFKSYPMDDASIRLETPGWYTILLHYGDHKVKPVYVKVTQSDIEQVPLASVDEETGVVTVSANGFPVKGVYIQYTCDYNGEDAIPAGYRLPSDESSWYKFWSRGQAVTANDFNGENGYQQISIDEDLTAIGKRAVQHKGWYSIYIKYSGGVQMQYIALEDNIQSQTIGQKCGDADQDVDDYRMSIRYQDIMDASESIKKYAYGYLGGLDASEEQIEAWKNIHSWYRMTLTCGNNKVYAVTTSEEKPIGRAFEMVVDKQGYYIVMTEDLFYGTQYYIVKVGQDVSISEGADKEAPSLFVENNVIIATKENGSIKFIKEASSETFTRGHVLRPATGGNIEIITIDESGRMYKNKATVDTDVVDRSAFYDRLNKLNALLEGSQAIADEEYEDALPQNRVATTYTKQTVYEQAETKYATYDELYNNPDATQVEVDEAVSKLDEIIKTVKANTKTVEPDIISVEGDSIHITFPKDASVDYIIFNVEDETNPQTGYKPLRDTVWKDWSGISSEDYYTVTNLNDRIFSDYAETEDTKTVTLSGVEEGIYTFQIKYNGKVYFRNPIVSQTNDTDVAVNWLEYEGNTDIGLIADAKNLLTSVYSATDAKNNHVTPYVNDELYEKFSNEVEVAKELVDARTEESKADAYVDEIATLRYLMKQVESARVYSLANNVTTFTCTEEATGQWKAVNASKQLSVMYIAKGTYDTWYRFSQNMVTRCTLRTEADAVTSLFQINGDGDYTAYVKYTNGTYEWKYFRHSGYSAFPVTVVREGANIKLTIPEEVEEKIETLAYTNSVTKVYKSTKFTDVTEQVSHEMSLPIISANDHTIYIKTKEGEEYFYNLSVGEEPLVNVIENTEDGTQIRTLVQDGAVAWVAYAKGNCSTWVDMLQSEDGVHYIAQNEEIIIPNWTQDDEYITFYLKGTEGHNDYKVVVRGRGLYSTVEDHSYNDYMD